MSWNEHETASYAPCDALSPHYPHAGGVLFDASVPNVADPGEFCSAAAEALERQRGVRAWLGWVGDDGFVKVLARLPPQGTAL